MSVSDEAGGAKPKPNWPAIRLEYESGTISQRNLAKLRGVSRTTLEYRARHEGWIQSAKLARKSASEVEAAITEKVQARFKRELAPWIEAQKTRFTKRTVKVVSKGLDRCEKMLDDDDKLDAKNEAYLSKAAQTYIQTGRTALGMDDGKANSGGLNVNLLCNQALIQTAPAAGSQS